MWIEVFKSGYHTDKNGYAREYTPAQLVDIASNYNKKVGQYKHLKVPILKDHNGEKQFYGFVKGLTLRGDKLLADLEFTDKKIIEAIEQGKIKNISIGMQGDDLVEVSLLETELPAVEDLIPIDESVKLQNIHTPNKEEIIKEINDYIIELGTKKKVLSPPGKDIALQLVEKLSNNENYEELTNMFKSFLEDLSKKYLLKEYSYNKNRRNYNYEFSLFGSTPERYILHNEVLEEIKHNPILTYEQALIRVIDK